MAETVGVDDQASHFEGNLEEDKCTDEKLTELAEQINTQANDMAMNNKTKSSRDKKKSSRVA